MSYEEILANKDNYIKWKYETHDIPISSGYEDVMDEILSYTQEEYHALGDGSDVVTPEQHEFVAQVRNIYRRKDIFPTRYYSELGVLEEIQKCIDYEATFDGDTVNTGAGVGTGLCNFFHPNLFATASIQDKSKEMYNATNMFGKFRSDKFLDKAIRFCYSYKDGAPTPSAVFSGLRLVGAAPSNFRPMNAKAIWERFAPENGVVYDSSSGFGGRLLGALSSKKNLTYIGVDPNMESIYNTTRLAEAIESVTGRTNSYELHCCGSELDDLVRDDMQSFADVHFSSPPYFNLENYGENDSNNKNQSHVKFSGLEAWLEGYVRGTCRNIYKILKGGGYSIVNIADFDLYGRGMASFVDEWKRIAEEEGLEYYTNIYLGVTARAGTKQFVLGEPKREVILVFKSTKPEWE